MSTIARLWSGAHATLRRAAAGLLATVALGSTFALAPITAQAADVLVSSFTDVPDPGIRGGTITFTVTLQNNDSDTANNVVLTYALPVDTVFVSAADTVVAGACVHDGATPGVVTCTYPTLLGTIASPTAGPVRTVNIVLRTTGASVTTLASSVTATTTDTDTNPGNNSLTQNTSINDGADLTASMTGTPNPATGGGLVIWTVSGSNLGPNTSGPVTYTTTLPGVLTYAGGSSGGNGWTCGAAGQVVTCTRPAVAVGAYPDLPIGTVITGVAAGTVTLSGSISSTVGDPDPSNNSTVASVTVNPGTDLAVTQDAPSPNPAASGSGVTFVIRPVNNGPYAATAGATVTFPLPAGFVVSSTTGSTGWTCSSAGAPATVTCNFAGSLAASAPGVLTVVATTPSVGGVTAYNNITASIAPNAGGPADPNSSNNSAAVNVNVSPDGLDLRVSKTKTPSFVAVGSNMTSTIGVQNLGPRTAASGSITVTDALDNAHEQYVSFSGTNWSCVSAPPNVVCTYNAALPIATAPDLLISTVAVAPGGATNTATASYSGTPGDLDLSNNSAAVTVTVTAANNSPDLMVAVSAATAGGVQTTIEFNETRITYTVVVTNKGSSTAAAHDIVTGLTIPGRLGDTNVAVSGQVLTNTSGTSNATFTCIGTGTGINSPVTCTQAGGTTLAIGDVYTFTITADRAIHDGSDNATATAFSSTQGDPVPSDNTAAVRITIDSIADVEVVSKLLAQNPVLAGTNAIYTITLRDNGPSGAQNVTLADVFTIPAGDSGFTFVSATASDSGTCSGLVANTSYTSGTPTVNCSWPADVDSGNTRTVTVTLRPNWQAGTAARTLANTATVSTTTPEDSVGGQGSAPNSKSITLNINPAQVDLLINNTDTPDPLGYDGVIASNNDVTYTIAETNSGPSLASGTGFTFVMTPPSGKSIVFRGDGAATGVAAANPTGTIASSVCNNLGSSVTGPASLTVTCTYAAPGQLASGATQTRYLVWRVSSVPSSAGDTYNTNATTFQNETDTNPVNNSEAEGTTVRKRVDLTITKTASINPVQIRQPFTWTVVVTNNGPDDSNVTSLTDTLPTGMQFNGTPTYSKSSGGTGNCTVAGATMTCALGALPATAIATITLPATVQANPVGGVTQNCATTTSSDGTPASVVNFSTCTNLTVQTSALSGTVFQDRDRAAGNGGTPQSASTEPRIQGVSVELTGTDAYGNGVARSSLTDVNGFYALTDLSPSDANGYTLREIQPAGYVNGPIDPPAPATGGVYTRGGTSGSSTFGPIVLSGNTTGADYNFPEVRMPSLSGFVYIDNNGNNVRDAGTDTAIAGATVRLLNASTLALIATTTTDGTGAYTFAGLDPLTAVTVEEPLPALPIGLQNGAVNPGLIGGAPCTSGCTAQPNTPIAGTDRVAGIALGAGTDGTLFNFGERLLSTSGAINGRVYLDLNNNGTVDGAETGIAGVAITLTGTDTGGNAVSRTTVTDANGNYAFTNVAPGTYSLTEPTQPPSTLNGRTTAGSAGGTATAPATTPSTITSITLGVGTVSANNLFAEIPAATLAGLVYTDNNNNGTVDAGESGIGGVTVTLTGTDDLGAAVSLTTTTAADGSYAFAAQRPGTYTVTEPTQPAGTLNGITSAGSAGGTPTTTAVTPSAIGGVVLAPGAQGTLYNFGEIGSSPDLLVSKDHTLARFTVNNPASYRIRVRNAGELPTTGVYTVTDRLPTGLTLAATPTGTGWACIGAFGASTFTCTSSTVVASAATNPNAITVSVLVGAAAAAASPINNVAMVEGGGELPARQPTPAERDLFANNPAGLPICSTSIAHNACRDPTVVQQAASLAGTVWFDIGSAQGLLDSGDQRLPGWQVMVVDSNGVTLATTTTAADGSYRVADLLPGVPVGVRFRDPGSGVVFGYPVNGETAPNSSGVTCNEANAIATGGSSSCVNRGTSPQLSVVLASGQNLTQQSLPVDPGGVVYDSIARQPVAGSIVTLAPVGACAGWNPSTSIVGATLGGYTVNGTSIAMTVGAGGFYQYLFSSVAPASCQFGLTVTPPSGYRFTSTVIPPQAASLTPPGGAGSTYAVQPQAGAPTAAAGTATNYYLTFTSGSGGANIVHNHIAIDSLLPGGLTLSKTGDKTVAEVGDSVRYSVTVRLTSGLAPIQVTVVDRVPAGFTYIKGTASVNGTAIADPAGGVGPTLAFNLGPMPSSGQQVLQYRLRVGVGSQQGDGTNIARAYACGLAAGCVTSGFAPVAVNRATNEGRHTVHVSGGVFATEACIVGKIFVDCNGNQIQDPEEIGIPGVRLVMQDGTTFISDSEGKYSYCGVPPRSAVLKVDPSTLPRGSRLVTSSNRNLGDAGSLWLDLKNGELHRADFIEGSCSAPVIEQVKARRAQGEVRSNELEKKKTPALRFESKALKMPLGVPREATDSANQPVPKPRDGGADAR